VLSPSTESGLTEFTHAVTTPDGVHLFTNKTAAATSVAALRGGEVVAVLERSQVPDLAKLESALRARDAVWQLESVYGRVMDIHPWSRAATDAKRARLLLVLRGRDLAAWFDDEESAGTWLQHFAADGTPQDGPGDVRPQDGSGPPWELHNSLVAVDSFLAEADSQHGAGRAACAWLLSGR
jgi:hypothetical protein